METAWSGGSEAFDSLLQSHRAHERGRHGHGNSERQDDGPEKSRDTPRRRRQLRGEPLRGWSARQFPDRKISNRTIRAVRNGACSRSAETR